MPPALVSGGRAASLRCPVGIGVALAIGIAGCSSAGVGTDPVPLGSSPTTSAAIGLAPPAPTITWTPCAGGRDCGTVNAPLDYTHPGVRTVPIAVARRRASGLRIGSLLVDPGGPGESGVAFAGTLDKMLSPTLLDHFDVVEFDPRGVGLSAPVRCLDASGVAQYLHLDPAPTTAVAYAALVAGARTLVAGCQGRSGGLLPFVGTANAARDMDLIRQALGEDKLTYLGFSYGSLLGTTYAELFPTHVRAMVFDGAIDPALDPVTIDDAQAAGFDRSLNAFFDDCRSSGSCLWRPGPDPRSAFHALMASLRSRPLRVGGREVGPGEAFLGVVRALYSRVNWPVLAQALQHASTGDGSVILQLADDYAERQPDGTYTNTLEANIAITCADQQWPSDPAAYPALAAAAVKQAPEFGAANVYSSLPCALWPRRGASRPHPVSAPGSPPLLVLGSTGDPATPYAWAEALARELEHGVLLTRRGEGHTAYTASACIRRYADAYLSTGALPPVGTTCD